jgi:cytochrome c oxidase subunit 2
VDDVDRVVSPIGSGDPEEQARPAPEPEPPFAGKLTGEDERAPDLVEIDAALLRNAVHEHLVRVADLGRQLDLTPVFHLYTMPSGVRRTAFATLGTTFVALAVTGLAYAGNGGFLPGQAHSPNAHRITSAFVFVAIFTGIIFVIVEGALIAFIVRYRRGRRARTAEAPQIHGSTRLEIIWTVVPVFILAAIGVFVFWELPGIKDAPKAAAADQTTIRIEGHQFYWLFRYPNGAVSINRMVAPADQVVHEDVVGLDFDVNHSWWVPNLGGKYDAIPGHVNRTWFKAPAGDYVARCAELCGLQHALMDGVVHVVPRAEYDTFIQQRAANASGVELGKEEWQGVCQSCHRLDHAYVGPALGGNVLLGDVEGLATLLRNGGIQMPPVGKNWSQAQIEALVGYTKQFAKKGSS